MARNTHASARRTGRTRSNLQPGTVLTPRCKIWLERDGKVALSDWRVELLEAIEKTGSLTTAAKQLKVPYRTAWCKLKELEEKLEIQLLATASGGAAGGGSRLTPDARLLIRRFHRVTAGVRQLIEERFRQGFGGANSSHHRKHGSSEDENQVVSSTCGNSTARWVIAGRSFPLPSVTSS